MIKIRKIITMVLFFCLCCSVSFAAQQTITSGTGTTHQWSVQKARINANFSELYGWGNHALAGYLLSESEPLFVAWDKDYADLINKPTIPNDNQTAAEVAVTATGFDGNLAATDDTVQKVAQKLDDLILSGGTIPSAGIALSDGTDWLASLSYAALQLELNGENFAPTGSVDMTGASSVSMGQLEFEGTTADDYETTFSIIDPTADRLIYTIDADMRIPAASQVNADGTLNVSGGTAPTIQSADPTSSSATGYYWATTSGDFFYKSDDGLFRVDGTYVADLATYSLGLTITGDGTITISSTGYTSAGSPYTITGLSGAINISGVYGAGEDTLTFTGDTVAGTYPDYTIDMGTANKTITGAFTAAGAAVTYGSSTVGSVALPTDSINTLYLFLVSDNVASSGNLVSYISNVRESTATRKIAQALYKDNGTTLDLVADTYTASSTTSQFEYTATEGAELEQSAVGGGTVVAGTYYIGMQVTGYVKVYGEITGGTGYTDVLAGGSVWPSSLTKTSLTASTLFPGKWQIKVQ